MKIIVKYYINSHKTKFCNTMNNVVAQDNDEPWLAMFGLLDNV